MFVYAKIFTNDRGPGAGHWIVCCEETVTDRTNNRKTLSKQSNYPCTPSIPVPTNGPKKGETRPEQEFLLLHYIYTSGSVSSSYI